MTVMKTVARPRAKRIYGTLAERFWAKVDKTSETGCWVWTAYRFHDGYGAIEINGRHAKAHRVSYELNIGPILDGLCVCHKCDNKICVRPDHLFADTQKENVTDMYRKGRDADRKGTNNPLAKLTDVQVREMRSDPRPQRVIAKEFNVSQSLVGLIKRRARWRHIS